MTSSTPGVVPIHLEYLVDGMDCVSCVQKVERIMPCAYSSGRKAARSSPTLPQQGAGFTVKDVRGDPDALAQMQQRANVRIAPVTVIGEQIFYGPFDDQWHRSLAALKGAPAS